MKKKSLLSIGLSLSMVLTMTIPAFAANSNVNVNADGTAVTAPGNPDYAPAGNTQTSGQSYNEATITKAAGATDWATVNDDDALAGTNDHAADINVWAKVTDAKTKVYKVDLAWGIMQFEYNSINSTKWNTETHSYDKGDVTATWTPTYLNGTNNKVTVTNHSNNGIDATFAYAMDTKKFNDANGLNNVIGNFFDDNTKAVAAGLVLTNTYTNTSGAVNDAAVSNKLIGNKVALATSDAYNSTTGDKPATDNTNNQLAGPRTDDVFFAFSGTPDEGKGLTLKDFARVGVITVTVTPNNDVPLNRPPFK